MTGARAGSAFSRADHEIVAWRAGRAVSWRELMQTVGRLQSHLADTHGALINVCENPFYFLAAFLAVAHSGRTNLLAHNRSASTLREMQARYPGSGLLDDAHVEQWLAEPPELQDDRPLDLTLDGSSAPTTIVFTSGSTGVPTAHAKPWAELRAASRRLQERLHDYGLPPVTLVATVPAQHMYGLETTLLLPLLSANAIHCTRPFYPADIRAALEEIPAPRGLVTTPMHLKHLLDADLPMPPLSFVLCATAPLSPTLAQRAESRLGAMVVELYGASETGAIATRRPALDDVWQPLAGVRVLAEGEEARVSASHLPGTIALSDRVQPAADGGFRLLGRGADMIKIAGKRASLADLTHKLLAVPGVTDALFTLPEGHGEDPERVTRLVALVVAGPDTDAQRIKAALGMCVDPVFVPRTIYKVARLPRDGTGKVPRAALRALMEQLEQDS